MALPEDMDNERKWRIYLGLSEVAKALICLVLTIQATRLFRPVAFMGMVWFATQAQQEFMGLNEGATEQWEYYLVALMALVGAITLRKE